MSRGEEAGGRARGARGEEGTGEAVGKGMGTGSRVREGLQGKGREGARKGGRAGWDKTLHRTAQLPVQRQILQKAEGGASGTHTSVARAAHQMRKQHDI